MPAAASRPASVSEALGLSYRVVCVKFCKKVLGFGAVGLGWGVLRYRRRSAPLLHPRLEFPALQFTLFPGDGLFPFGRWFVASTAYHDLP